MLSATKLKEKALALGFDLVGIAPAGAAPHGESIKEWCDRGFCGEMAYMSRSAESRANTDIQFPWAKSIICVAMSYPSVPGMAEESAAVTGGESKLNRTNRGPAAPQLLSHGTQPSPVSGASDKPGGRVSCYAWGDDYHDVLGRVLTELESFAKDQGVCQTKSYVDTGPVLERDWAARAGLGWVGKNTMLINQGLGSWLFLGTLLLDAELAPDEPFPDRCGTCTECLDACPTGALVTPYLLDSRHCISYLTIENKGALPPRMRPLIADWVFGCDVCQSVCPWNTKSPRAQNPAFSPRDGLRPIDLEWALSNPEALSGLIARTPVERAKGHRLIRNIIVAAGNSGSLRVARALEPYAVNPPSELAEHISWALKRLRG